MEKIIKKGIMKKNIFKNILISLSIIALFNLFLVNNLLIVKAQPSLKDAASDLAGNSPIQTPQKIFDILKRIVQYVYTIFFVVAVIFIIIAAFNFLTGGDNPEKIKSAQNQILWASVAIAIALLSLGAAQIIKDFIETS